MPGQYLSAVLTLRPDFDSEIPAMFVAVCVVVVWVCLCLCLWLVVVIVFVVSVKLPIGGSSLMSL